MLSQKKCKVLLGELDHPRKLFIWGKSFSIHVCYLPCGHWTYLHVCLMLWAQHWTWRKTFMSIVQYDRKGISTYQVLWTSQVPYVLGWIRVNSIYNAFCIFCYLNRKEDFRLRYIYIKLAMLDLSGSTLLISFPVVAAIQVHILLPVLFQYIYIVHPWVRPGCCPSYSWLNPFMPVAPKMARPFWW